MPAKITNCVLAALACVPLAGPAAAQDFTGCVSDDAIAAADIAGTWRVEQANANVSGVPIGAAGSRVDISQAFATNVRLTIDGRNVTLEPSGRDDDAMTWEKGRMAPLSPEELELVLGCPLDGMPRWTGFSQVTQQGRRASIVWNMLAIEPDWAILQYALAGPPNAYGYFQIVR